MSQKINRSKLQGRLVYITHLLEMLDYDRLYENINNLDHFRWQEFVQNEHVQVEYIEDFGTITTTKPKTGYWFFKDRNDRRATEFKILDKIYQYKPNAFLYTAQKYAITHIKLEQNFQSKPAIKIKF